MFKPNMHTSYLSHKHIGDISTCVQLRKNTVNTQMGDILTQVTSCIAADGGCGSDERQALKFWEGESSLATMWVSSVGDFNVETVFAWAVRLSDSVNC